MRDNTQEVTKSYIKLHKGSLELSLSSMASLGVGVGDKVCIRFSDDLPVIATPEAISEHEGGNLISTTYTVSCRGAANKALREYGEVFDHFVKMTGLIVLKPLDITLEDIQTNTDSNLTVTIPGAIEVDFDYQVK